MKNYLYLCINPRHFGETSNIMNMDTYDEMLKEDSILFQEMIESNRVKNNQIN